VPLSRSRIAPFGGRAEIRQSDGAPRVDTPDGSFDRFVFTYVLDLLPLDEIRMRLVEAHRVLAPSGRLGVASLTRGRIGLSRVVTWAWQQLHRLRTELAGGCRHIELVQLLSQGGWKLRRRSVVSRYAISSEVVVAERT